MEVFFGVFLGILAIPVAFYVLCMVGFFIAFLFKASASVREEIAKTKP